MAKKNSKKQKILFFGGAISALVLLLTLILIFGKAENNFIADSAENIFYDQFFKKITNVQDSFNIRVLDTSSTKKNEGIRYTVAQDNFEDFVKKFAPKDSSKNQKKTRRRITVLIKSL